MHIKLISETIPNFCNKPMRNRGLLLLENILRCSLVSQKWLHIDITEERTINL